MQEAKASSCRLRQPLRRRQAPSRTTLSTSPAIAPASSSLPTASSSPTTTAASRASAPTPPWTTTTCSTASMPRATPKNCPTKDMFVSFMKDQKDITEQVERRWLRRSRSRQTGTVYLDSLENTMSPTRRRHIDSTLAARSRSPSTRGTSGYATTYRTSPTCGWCSPCPSRWVSSAARPTTGCGRARPATSPCSASMPIRDQRAGSLLQGPTCPTSPSTGHR
jgi:hypothetical protein